jgi:transcriptional regulator with XRE-family HTH domain
MPVHESDELKNIGLAIRLHRVNLGMSQKELAQTAELSISYVSLVERGKRDLTYTTLVKIGKALEVSITTLIQLAEQGGLNKS